MAAVEQYLKPELAAQIKRLDLRAKMVIRGFLQGLHASPFHGFSVAFSEHRRYAAGDGPNDNDWTAYANTGKSYGKEWRSKANVTAHIRTDSSKSTS